MDRARTRKAKTRLDKIIGNNIRVERELRKITRDELAEVTDLTVSHLGLIERGERGATPVTLEKVIKAFGITIDSLFADRSKSISAKESGKTASDAYSKKVTTLMVQLTESELEFMAHTIKGILSMRAMGLKKDSSSEKEILT